MAAGALLQHLLVPAVPLIAPPCCSCWSSNLTFLECALYDGNESRGQVEQWLFMELAVGHLPLRWHRSSWHRPAATVHAAETLRPDRWGVQCNYVRVHLPLRAIYSPEKAKERRGRAEKQKEKRREGKKAIEGDYRQTYWLYRLVTTAGDTRENECWEKDVGWRYFSLRQCFSFLAVFVLELDAMHTQTHSSMEFNYPPCLPIALAREERKNRASLSEKARSVELFKCGAKNIDQK